MAPAHPNLRLVILISGFGGNLQALINRQLQGNWGGEIVAVISNQANAYGLTRAQQAGIPCAAISHSDYSQRSDFDQALLEAVTFFKPDLVLLAGFMRILSPCFTEPLTQRLLNIHPSLLPAYKGLHTHERVLAAQEAWHGTTVHWVTPDLDDGPIVGQVRVPVFAQDTVETLSARVTHAEHYLYPAVIERLACGSIHPLGYQSSDLETYDPKTDSFTKHNN